MLAISTLWIFRQWLLDHFMDRVKHSSNQATEDRFCGTAAVRTAAQQNSGGEAQGIASATDDTIPSYPRIQDR